MVESCFNNQELIRQSALLEGAKMDMLLKNFLKEGKDYKGLKKDLKEIINANNLSKEDLASGKRGLLHVCKRILQVCCDIEFAFLFGYDIGYAAIGIAAGNPLLIIGAIVSFVIGFIVNRLIRFAVDTAEYKNLVGDAEEVISMLERKKNELKDKRDEAEDPDKCDREIEKIDKEIKKVRDALKKYGKKKR